ncbi:MAG: HEAT repeat domain-containing protein [Bryobacteraceae bacterium]
MRPFLLSLICCATLAAQPRIGLIEFYGPRKVPVERVRRALGVKEGDPFPASKGAVEERIEEIPGVVGARMHGVCCDAGKAILFVGIEEKGAPHFPFRSEPEGTAALPEEIVETYQQFLVALENAVRRGNTADDIRSGHSLMADPETRAIQERFPEFAEKHLAVLREVLRNSADAEQRAIAAHVIGYAPKKRDVIDELQYAVQDSGESVRNNAIRALGAIAVLAARDPSLEIHIEPTWFVEMLNSIVWTDRNKAVMVLLNLTDDRNQRVLDLVRQRALDSLVDMARWRSLSHAIGAFTLLGRAAGLTDRLIEDSWTKGEREAVIAMARKAGKKK